jgi:Fe-S-cluster-containing dehydrogenase component
MGKSKQMSQQNKEAAKETGIIIAVQKDNALSSHYKEEYAKMTLDEKEGQPVENSALSRRRFLGLTLAGGAMVSIAAGAVLQPAAQDNPEVGTAQYALIIDTMKCAGCGLCMDACHLSNRLPEGQSYTNVQERKDGDQIWFLAVQCQHCAEPPCATVCPTQATYIHTSGAVLINDKLCVGCKYCMVACPYQARIFNEERGVADKCSLCLDRVLQGDLPACVQVCPTGARVFGLTTDSASKISRTLSSGRAKPLHPEFDTHPAVVAYVFRG